MNIESDVHQSLRGVRGEGKKFGFQAGDYKSYEQFELTVAYLERLSIKGLVEIIDRNNEQISGERKLDIILVRVTETGQKWLSSLP